MAEASGASASVTTTDGATSKRSSEAAAPIQLLPTKACLMRIHQDIQFLERNPVAGIFAVRDETKVNLCHGLILGPEDTPYENGFFYFTLAFPFDYPLCPPTVTLQTTGAGRVRFNPNLYKCGKVCLSILGTWAGPSWSPVQTIGSVLLSIQSLMNDIPFHNEPGFGQQVVGEHAPNKNKNNACAGPKNYNHCIRHETLRIAVLDMVDMAIFEKSFPSAFSDIIFETLVNNAELYKYTCEEYMFLDGKAFQDPFHCNKGIFGFSKLKRGIDQAVRKVEDMLRSKEQGPDVE